MFRGRREIILREGKGFAEWLPLLLLNSLPTSEAIVESHAFFFFF
jgi:hypothetical protein